MYVDAPSLQYCQSDDCFVGHDGFGDEVAETYAPFPRPGIFDGRSHSHSERPHDFVHDHGRIH